MTPKAHKTRAAFTLIELMLAVALSTLIILVSYSAIRLAARATAMSESLSLQGKLLQAGYLQNVASEEIPGVIPSPIPIPNNAFSMQLYVNDRLEITDTVNGLTRKIAIGTFTLTGH